MRVCAIKSAVPRRLRAASRSLKSRRRTSSPFRAACRIPGAITLVATVRDLDGAFARLKQLGAPVVTRSGAPIKVGTVGRMVVVQDPAGHFIEIVQPEKLTEAQAAATGNVVGVRVRFTVRDVESALKLYRDALGFHELARLGQYGGDAAVLDALGLSGGQYRVGQLQVPTSGLQFTLIDFKGVERKTKLAGIKDPGSTRIQLRVADIDAAVAALGKAGGAFISTGGKPLDLPAGANTLKVGIVRDPDNLFVVLINTPPRAALMRQGDSGSVVEEADLRPFGRRAPYAAATIARNPMRPSAIAVSSSSRPSG